MPLYDAGRGGTSTARLVADEVVPFRPASADQLRRWLRDGVQRSRPVTRIGEELVRRGFISTAMLNDALARQHSMSPRPLLGQLLVEEGALTQQQLSMVLADWMGVRVVDLSTFTAEPGALDRLPHAMADRMSMLPLLLLDDALVVAVADPWDHAQQEELHFLTGLRIVALMATRASLPAAITRAYRARGTARVGSAGGTRDIDQLALELRNEPIDGHDDANEQALESDNTLVRLVNTMIADAIERRASDIHIETALAPKTVKIRLRIDGELVRYLEMPARFRFAIVARLKIMASLDIAERRKPQDGKITFAQFGGPPVELRVVTVPTNQGLEDVVLRLLGGMKPMPLADIGISAANLRALMQVIAKPYGMVLICGPTGCGKTTTLHSVMREINTEQRKIWTAEDPVEITQDGLRQVQMNPRIGWTFASAMRTFLRADPDVIMIGEMRDEDTARIAVEASLTGHLVLSTLHTNSAPESITRLLEIGIDPFNFSDSLLAILAQRLVRRLCPQCRRPEPPAAGELEALARMYVNSAAAGARESVDAVLARWRAQHGGDTRVLLYRRGACEVCAGHGYHGRLGLHELMVCDDATRKLIRARASAGELQAAALANGMVTLRQDGIEKVLAGLTDLPEVIAATNQ